MYPWRQGRRSRRGPGRRQAPPRRPTVPRARGMERTPPAAPRGRGPRGRGTSGAVGAARAGDADVVQIVARRFYRGARVAAFGPRSRGERAPARATPSDPTLRSRHARASACAHPGAGALDVRGTRPAGRTSRWSVAERVGAARGGGLIAVMPSRRFYPGASDGAHGLRRCAGEGDRHMPSGRPGRPTQVITGEPSERTPRHLEASARPRVEDRDVVDVAGPVDDVTTTRSRLPKPTTKGVPHRPPLSARGGGRRREHRNARGWRRGARVLRRYACSGTKEERAPDMARTLLCSLRENCRTRWRTGGERDDDC